MARIQFLFGLLATFVIFHATASDTTNGLQPNECPLHGDCSKGNCPGPQKQGKWRLPGLKLGQQHSSGVILVYQTLTSSGCCNKCANSTRVSLQGPGATGATVNCAYWVHLQYPASSASATGCSGQGPSTGNCGRCYIFPSGTAPTCDDTMPSNNKSTIGKACPFTHDDPHFLGAHGARFEFNGEPEKNFCLITQENLHLNMKMSGYYDSRTNGASVLKSGKAVRTWIREIGLTWRDESNAEHTFTMAARSGKEQQRKEGFLSSASSDGTILPRLVPGEKKIVAGGLELTFVGYQKSGAFDVDAYTLVIPGLLELDVKLRIAHPLLQSIDDAQTHINLGFTSVKNSANVHGIMGQTYRQGREKKALDYNALSALLHRPFSADGELGKGFLDGEIKEYETSSLLANDCRFSVYNGKSLPSSAS